jgi:hypothetical protein
MQVLHVSFGSWKYQNGWQPGFVWMASWSDMQAMVHPHEDAAIPLQRMLILREVSDSCLHLAIYMCCPWMPQRAMIRCNAIVECCKFPE